MIHERTRGFTMGVDELNALIGEIVPPYTILIEGHPGAGKTTLGSSICYHNALRGKNASMYRSTRIKINYTRTLIN